MGTLVRGLVSVALLSSLAGMAGAQEVPWRSQYASAKKEARARNLPMLIAIGCPGCGWCDKLHHTTLRDSRVSSMLKSRYVPVAVMSRNDPWLMQALSINAYPTVIVATADGDIMFRHEGYLDAGKLYKELEQVASIAPAQQQPLMMSSAQRAVSNSGVQPVNFEVLNTQPVRTSYHVGAPNVSSHETSMPASQKIEQARYELIKSAVRSSPEVVPAQYVPTPSESMMAQPTMTQVQSSEPMEPVIMSTSMRELQPIGPRYYGYPPATRSPYAR